MESSHVYGTCIMSRLAVCCDPDGSITRVLVDEACVLGAQPVGESLGLALAPSAVGMFFELMSVLARTRITSEWMLEFETRTGTLVYRCAAVRRENLVLIVGGREPPDLWRTLIPDDAPVAARLAGELDERARDPHAQLIDLRRQVLALQEQTKLPSMLENELIRVAAHDLRNPLLVMKMNSSFLLQRGKVLDADVRNVLEDMLETCEFMNRFLDGMASLSKIWVGEIELERIDIELDQMLRDVVRRCANIAATRDIEIELTRADAVTVCADERKLLRVLHELFVNAMKFCPPGSSVRAQLSLEGARARIRVEDDGPGIPEATRNVLFRPFGKSPIDEPMGYGAGIGLPIARRIVEAHSGALRVISVEDEGTQIEIELPARPVCDRACDR